VMAVSGSAAASTPIAARVLKPVRSVVSVNTEHPVKKNLPVRMQLRLKPARP
jgi:hypothetical protein